MSVGIAGVQGAFAKTEDYGLSVHFANRVIDKYGNGQNLIQYSYISLKQDVLCWLKQNGRLPSTSTKEYFQEIQTLNKIAKENELNAYKHNGFWKAMDTLKDQNELESLWLENNAKWKIW